MLHEQFLMVFESLLHFVQHLKKRLFPLMRMKHKVLISAYVAEPNNRMQICIYYKVLPTPDNNYLPDRGEIWEKGLCKLGGDSFKMDGHCASAL